MATLKDKKLSYTPSLVQLRSTHTSLQTVTHILAGLNHRNKNQHRGTKWWPAFNMLRRSLQKLMLDLEAAIQRVEVLSLSVPTTTKQMKKAASSTSTTVKPVKQPELDRVVERAVWMKAVLGPRVYETFSHLTADRQFAHLGLVLIGVLAQVEAAMAPFVPADPTAPPPPKPQLVGTSGSVGIVQGTVDASKAIADAGDSVDLGVAISRDELDDETFVQPSIEPSSSIQEHHDTGNQTKGKKRKQSLRNENTKSRAEVSGFSSEQWEIAEKRKKPPAAENKPKSAKPGSILEELQEPPKKRKKPKLDISSSSLADEQGRLTNTVDEAKAVKKAKKKKKKGGDEFDDLFSSLL